MNIYNLLMVGILLSIIEVQHVQAELHHDKEFLDKRKIVNDAINKLNPDKNGLQKFRITVEIYDPETQVLNTISLETGSPIALSGFVIECDENNKLNERKFSVSRKSLETLLQMVDQINFNKLEAADPYRWRFNSSQSVITIEKGAVKNEVCRFGLFDFGKYYGVTYSVFLKTGDFPENPEMKPFVRSKEENRLVVLVSAILGAAGMIDLMLQ